MKENSNIHKESSHVRDRFKMDPPEGAWNRLNTELERKQTLLYKQRGNRFKLLSVGLALLLISAVTYYYISPFYRISVANTANKSTGHAVKHGQPKRETKSLTDNNAEVKTSSASLAIVPEGGLGTRNAKPSASVPRSSSLHIVSRTKSNVGETNVTKEGNNLSHNDNRLSNSDKSLIRALKQPEKNNSEKNITGDEEKNNASATTPNVGNRESGKSVSKEDNPPIASQADNSTKQVESANQDKMFAAPSIDSESSKTIQPAHDSTLNKNNSDRSRWAIAAFYSPNYYAKNNLEAANAYGYGQSTSDYSMREKSDYSFATGLSLRHDLTAHWSVSVGATYSTIAYSINIPTVYAKYNSDYELYYLYPTSCGNIEIPNPSNTVLNYGDSLNIKGACVQVVKILSIPVTARYQIMSNSFTFYADAGFSVNIVTQAKSTLMIGNAETTIINNVDGLNKMNYGYLFGGGVEYTLNNGFSVFVEPSFRGSITSLTQNISFNCYPVAFSLNIGVSFHF